MKPKNISHITAICLTALAGAIGVNAETGYVECPYTNTVTQHATARRSPKGILVIGEGKNLMACEPFNGSAANARAYAEIANKYHTALGDSVTVWCMPIPTAAAFYLPDGIAGGSAATHTYLKNMFEALAPSVKGIDLFAVLAPHAAEHIYSRTDHHWQPLGAYYAAQALAENAGVGFLPLADYDTHVQERFIGSWLKFSGDERFRNAPERFVWHTPREIDVTTTYTNFTADKSKPKGLAISKPVKGSFFVKTSGSMIYCTFMGGDSKLTKIETPTKNGRKALIFKDSFGNPIPAYLFGSFEEIHVVDFRYFPYNIVDYVRDNGITDVVFANNVVHSSTQGTRNKYLRFLTQ